MLTCKEFLQELNDFLDETADVELRRQLEAHITQCPNCWVVCDTTKKTIQVYKGMAPQVIPEAVHARLIAALEKKMALKKQA
ncbi:MAG: anti-sigma factor family protein [Bryobacteraceae bacterium]